MNKRIKKGSRVRLTKRAKLKLARLTFDVEAQGTVKDVLTDTVLVEFDGRDGMTEIKKSFITSA